MSDFIDFILFSMKFLMLTAMFSCGMLWSFCPRDDKDPTKLNISLSIIATFIVCMLAAMVLFK